MANLQLANMLEICQQINNCKSISEIKKFILMIVSSYGIENILAGIMPPTDASVATQLSNVLFGLWPEEWSRRYFSKGYLERDPTIVHTRSRNSSLDWSDIQADKNIVMNEATEFRLKQGVTIPMRSIDGAKIGMSFAGEHISHSPEAKMMFHLLSSVATARVLEITQTEAGKSNTHEELTPSEMSCLHWLCEGKTSWEIGMIKGISEKTVDKHLGNAIRKTNSNNRHHLVANALKLGIIK